MDTFARLPLAVQIILGVVLLFVVLSVLGWVIGLAVKVLLFVAVIGGFAYGGFVLYERWAR